MPELPASEEITADKLLRKFREVAFEADFGSSGEHGTYEALSRWQQPIKLYAEATGHHLSAAGNWLAPPSED